MRSDFMNIDISGYRRSGAFILALLAMGVCAAGCGSGSNSGINDLPCTLIYSPTLVVVVKSSNGAPINNLIVTSLPQNTGQSEPDTLTSPFLSTGTGSYPFFTGSGTHLVTASAFGYQTVSKTVVIPAGVG